MKIFLVRHGDKQKIKSTDFFVKRAVSLNQTGIQQVEELAHFLRENYPIVLKTKHIFSSIFPRAIQTAEILRRDLKLEEIKIMSVLGELYATDDYTITKEIRNEMFRHAMIDIDFVPDTKISFRTRIEELIKFFKQQYREDTPLIVSTHGALIRNTIYFLFPNTKPSADKILESCIQNGGVTILNYDGNKFELERFAC